MKTYVIVDSKIFAYRASYQRNEPILSTLVNIEQVVNYLHTSRLLNDNYEVIMGFDFGKSRYRKELISTYKGHRTEGLKEKPVEEQERYDKFQDDYRFFLPKLVDALGVRVVGVEGVEFDDLGSILAHSLQDDIIILTEDRDFLQLPLSLSNVKQFLPFSYTLIDYKKAVEMEGVTNKTEFLVAKTIKGDFGDSIKGLVQCGPACFKKWFTPLRGLGLSLESWKEAFVSLAKSNKIFDIHKDYINQGIDSFEALFDKNIALGETMIDTSKLNKQELRDLDNCLDKVLTPNKVQFLNLLKEGGDVHYNEFGDVIKPPEFQGLRGKLNGG